MKFMKVYVNLILLFLFCAAIVSAQTRTEVEKLVETEKTFARTAGEKTVKQAFLDFLSDDAVMFTPLRTNGKEYWRNRPESQSSLVWYPVFADVSSNGALGYTTGHAEFRREGKTSEKVFYTDFFTVWRRQADGNYKAVLDVGVSHDKLPSEDMNWTSPKTTENFSEENKPIAANTINQFFETAMTKGLSSAYKTFLSTDVRFLREGKFPIIGKNNALATVGKSRIVFGKDMTLQSAGNLAYVVTTFDMKNGDQTVERGNIIQVWKLLGGKWQIVADVIAPIPLEKK